MFLSYPITSWRILFFFFFWWIAIWWVNTSICLISFAKALKQHSDPEIPFGVLLVESQLHLYDASISANTPVVIVDAAHQWLPIPHLLGALLFSFPSSCSATGDPLDCADPVLPEEMQSQPETDKQNAFKQTCYCTITQPSLTDVPVCLSVLGKLKLMDAWKMKILDFLTIPPPSNSLLLKE